MIKYNISLTCKLFAFLLLIQFFSCKEYDAYNQKPETGSLQQGLKLSSAIGYCVSIATSAFKGYDLPANVVFDRNSGLIYIKIDKNNPLPFNKNIGDIIIACLWNNNSGVMSVLFGNFDILGGNIKLYGLYTIPFTERNEQEGIVAFFAQEDIILGNGSDTILKLGNITDIVFNLEQSRLNTEKPKDAFAVVKQNIWFINIDQRHSYSNFNDDIITINGGGQIAEVRGESGGILYHAIIDAKLNFAECLLNPISGFALSQNFKAGGVPFIDLGNSFLSFHNKCDGKAHVEVSTGKYTGYNGKDISLDIY